MSLPAIEGSVAIITGASAGIGQAAAREFARAGAAVVLAARNAEALQALAREIAEYPAEALVVPTDVTKGHEVEALARSTLSRFGRIDLLICNAGVGLYSPVKHLSDDLLREAFEVNFHGVLRCIQAALPSMIERGTGLIQIISSVIGRRAVPGYSGYCATKFALYALAESLRLELSGTGVFVQTVYPGLTDTEFSRNALARNPSAPPRRLAALPPEAVARHMLRAARRGSRDHIVTFSGRVLSLVSALAPGLVDAVLAHALSTGKLGDLRAVPDRRQ